MAQTKTTAMKQKKTTLIFLITYSLLSLANSAFSQSVNISNTSTSQVNTLGNAEYHVSEHIYSAAEIGASNFITAGTAINRIQFECTAVGTVTSFGNVKVYMQNVASGTTTFTAGTYSTAGYTTVYSGSFSVTTVGQITIDLTTPFVRTAGTNLQVMIERTDGIAKGPTFFTYKSITTVASSSRRYNGATALSGTTSLGTSAFRSAITLIHMFNNDLGVDRIETLGKIPTVVAFPHSVKALVTNYGLNAIPSGTNITLNISGANTISNVQTTSSIAPGASQTITFAAINSMVVGTNTITVSIPTDENTANNTATFGQTVVTNGSFSYADTSARNSSVGFNTGAGLLVSRHTFSSPINISAIRALITTQSNTLYGVVCNSAGVIIGQSPNYVVQPSDSGSYVTFNFSTPINIGPGPDSVFFIGVAQTAGTYGYFPLGSQVETPARANTFASIPLAGGAPTYYTTLGRFMIEGIASAVSLPVNLSYFSGRLSNRNAELVWATLTESNTDKFEVERMSGTSAEWTKIATLNAAGNSSSFRKYSVNDNDLSNGKHLYRLKMMDKDGKFTYSNVITLEVSSRSLFVLNQNYPNPVKGSTQLSYQLTGEGKVVIDLFTQDGRRVASLINQQQTAGTYSFSVDIKKYGLATGNYNYRMIVVDKNNQELFRATKTMVVTQ